MRRSHWVVQCTKMLKSSKLNVLLCPHKALAVVSTPVCLFTACTILSCQLQCWCVCIRAGCISKSWKPIHSFICVKRILYFQDWIKHNPCRNYVSSKIKSSKQHNVWATMCSQSSKTSIWAYGLESSPHQPDVYHRTNTVLIAHKLNHSHGGSGSKPLSGANSFQ